MWDWGLYVRYLLVFLMLVPGSVCCLLPVMDHLRFSLRRVLAIMGVLLLVLCGGGAALCTKLGLRSDLAVLACMLLLLIPYRLLVRGLSLWKQLFAFCNAAMLMQWSAAITCVAFVQTERNVEGPFAVGTSLACFALAGMVMLLFSKVLRYRIPALFDTPQVDGYWRWLFLLPLVLAAYYGWCLPEDLNELLVGRSQLVLFVSLSASMAATFGGYWFFWSVITFVKRVGDLQGENQLLKAEELRYRQLYEYIQASRQARHDFRQHLRVISELAAQERYEELKDYVGEYVQSVAPAQPIYSNFPAVDALAGYYRVQAEARGIDLECSLALPAPLPFKESDFCIILGNLLENAVHASEAMAQPERKIEVKAAPIGEGMIGLSVVNRFEGRLTLGPDGLPVNAAGEDIGLSSVASAVKRSNGTMAVSAEAGWFKVNILFNLEFNPPP